MSNIKYDKYGGIINTLQNESGNKTGREKIKQGKEKRSYSALEKFLIKHSRKINYLLDDSGRYQCRQEKTPQIIRIGPTNRCTAQCFYCPREHVHSRESGYMDYEMYEKIVKWAKENRVKVMSFALFGEPLLHPRIVDIIDLAHKNGLSMRLSTNAIILNKNLANKILAYPFDAIEMSMDGFNKDEYLRGKQVNQFDQARENILYFLSQAKEKKVKTVFNLHFVDIGNVSFLNRIKYVRFWKKQLRGLNHATSFYYEPHNWAGTRSDIRKEMNFIDRLLSKIELKKPCIYVKGLNINWNGDVLACGNDPTPKAVIGNIDEADMEKIYNGERRMKYLEANEKGDFRELNCGVCTVNTVLPLLFIKKRIINNIVSFFSA